MLKNIFMVNTKPKSRRKRYVTEFLLRTDNPTFIKDLDRIARAKKWSVNILIVSEMERLIAKSKKAA